MIWWILIQHVQTQIQIRNSFYDVSSDSSSDDCFCSLFIFICNLLFLACIFALLYLDESDEGILFNISISSGVNSCSVSLFVYLCFVFFFVLSSESSELLQTASFFLGGFVDFCLGCSNNVCKSVSYFCFNSFLFRWKNVCGRFSIYCIIFCNSCTSCIPSTYPLSYFCKSSVFSIVSIFSSSVSVVAIVSVFSFSSSVSVFSDSYTMKFSSFCTICLFSSFFWLYFQFCIRSRTIWRCIW